MRRRHITAIVLGGLFTSYGRDDGSRRHDRGFNVVFASDAMADIHPSEHAHSVESVFPRLGEVDTSRSILALMPAARAA
jgi:nicotinamidase-related amidase